MHTVLTEVHTIKINVTNENYNGGRVPLLQENVKVNDLLRDPRNTEFYECYKRPEHIRR
jgi:hypothetical protein